MQNDLSLVQEGRRLCGEEWIFQLDNDVIHNASITKKYLLEQKKTSWPPSVLSRHKSYWEFVGIDCCKSLWRKSTELSNFWTHRRNVRLMGKIPSALLQKLVNSMPNWTFKVIKAYGGLTKYQIKKIVFIFYSSAHWSYIYVKTRF